MSAAVLRAAAALMRKDAQAMMPGSPWEDRKGSVWRGRHCSPNRHPMARGMGMLMSRHVATFGDPAVALAVAHHLAVVADGIEGERRGDDPSHWRLHETAALAVAHAYLGTADP